MSIKLIIAPTFQIGQRWMDDYRDLCDYPENPTFTRGIRIVYDVDSARMCLGLQLFSDEVVTVASDKIYPTVLHDIWEVLGPIVRPGQPLSQKEEDDLRFGLLQLRQRLNSISFESATALVDQAVESMKRLSRELDETLVKMNRFGW